MVRSAQLVSEAVTLRAPPAFRPSRHRRKTAETRISSADWASRVQAAVRGDAREYRRLLRAVGQLARKIARHQVLRCNFPRVIVDDVVQETLFAVHQKLPHWDFSRPLETWVITVARNKTIDAMRESRLHRLRPLDDLNEFVAPPFANDAESRIDVPRLMSRLSPRGREIVAAIALREESIEDVATRLAMSKGALRVALHRAIRRMGEFSSGRELIQPKGEAAECVSRTSSTRRVRLPSAPDC